MKKFTLALSVLAVTVAATGAQAMISERANTQDLTTAQVKQIIQQQGSAVLSTAPGIFDRYVSNRIECGLGKHTKPAFVPTADSSSAFVGYTCFVDTNEGEG